MRRVYWSWVLLGLVVIGAGGVLAQHHVVGWMVMVVGFLVASYGMGPPNYWGRSKRRLEVEENVQ